MRQSSKILTAGIAAALALTLSACAPQAEPAPAPMEPAPSEVSPGDQSSLLELNVESLGLNDESLLEGNTAQVVDARTLNLALGGSGSCPPEIAGVDKNGDSFTVNLVEPEPNKACTMDYRIYSFIITSEVDVFGDATTVETVQGDIVNSVTMVP